MKYILLVASYLGDTLGNMKGISLINLSATWAPDLRYVKCFSSKAKSAIDTAELYLDTVADNSKFMVTRDVKVEPNEIFNLDPSNFIGVQQSKILIAEHKCPSIDDFLLSDLADEEIRFDIKVKSYKAYTTLEKELDSINDGDAIILCCSSLLINSLLIIADRDMLINDSDNLLNKKESALMPSSELDLRIINHNGHSAQSVNEIFETISFINDLIKQSKQ